MNPFFFFFVFLSLLIIWISILICSVEKLCFFLNNSVLYSISFLEHFANA